MNRFRTKKRTKEDVSLPRPSHESDAPSSFRPFRKNKKAQEPEKTEIDLATALPSSDDFRTSLLMTGLSARFSMLREQDDPNSKIGKASDDSVLFPHRQSRMDFAALRGLGDIAEVESIRAAAPFTRMDSFNSSDDADSLKAASVMSRAKPTEGNNLFGGRQKIYKIPAGATSSKTLAGGMGGRALYDDDVGFSAFQRWRQAEKDKERKSSEDERDEPADMDTGASRADSPFMGGYNRKRETSSTTSSVPSMARNSTAATSITSSHPASSLKDWQPSSSSTPSLERSVTRTRRLYETGLNHDLHEQQSTALSRIDTLTRQRTFGTRTPDLAQNSPSPTTLGFPERFGSERKILAKGSAPNLRSMSPPTTASSAGTPDLGIRVPSGSENRPNFGAIPPLSPPISEADEQSMLSIAPNDRGKATALGVFQKPAQPYDESRYAQRQIQLQQGRETPTQRFRDEPTDAFAADRSRSSSSVRRQYTESGSVSSITAAQPLVKEPSSATFLADPDDSETSPAASPKSATISPRVLLRRPSDREHPAFRDSAMPTPLSMIMKPTDEPSPINEFSSSVTPNSKDISPVDSPTLGPTSGGGAGLSGMVRQHLRGDSNASSIYGAVPPTADLESRFPPGVDDARAFHDFASDANPWSLQNGGGDWSLDLDVNEPIVEPQGLEAEHVRPAMTSSTRRKNRDSRDEFADQLADGARRIRERLTTYVETDSRSTSPHPIADWAEAAELPPPSRPNPLGMLRSKSSRGSIVERGRGDGSKAMRMLGVSTANSSQATSPVRESNKEAIEREHQPPPQQAISEAETTTPDAEPHAGLKAFRQARRELQRVREMETQARHQQSSQPPSHDAPPLRQVPDSERLPQQRSPGRERQLPPISYQPRGPPPGEEFKHGRPHPGSRGSSTGDRDRSGSDSSAGVRSNSRPPRPRQGTVIREDFSLAPSGAVQRPMRSPGLPGTDIRHSPIMPPQPYPGAQTRTNMTNLAPNGNLHAIRTQGFESDQPSPVSPIPSPFTSSAPPTPMGLPPSPHRPSHSNSSEDNSAPVPGLNDAMKRKVKPRDISEPTFVMSTSRVPTVSLPAEAAANRSRSNSRSAPPVPPINPRRRQDTSKTRTMFENMTRRRGDSVVDDGATASTPNLPSGNVQYRGLEHNDFSRSHFPGSGDDGARPERTRVLKQHTAPAVPSINGRARGNSPPVNVGPPASRMVVTQNRNRPGMGMSGGMI
ncbi:hypothetical protein F4778DRAFT_508904 [Xylariomycetidae sp. FL2044]|nr:hypothetical protein F4778DRAFT_508904 [Xylariomycetidae sp. FL2044]